MTRRKRIYTVPQMPDDSLWLWGRMKDFERYGYFEKDIKQLLTNLPDFVIADLKRTIPKAAVFFGQLAKVVLHA